MGYLVVTWLHMLSSTLLFGTGIGSAYYMLMASLSRELRIVAHTVRRVAHCRDAPGVPLTRCDRVLPRPA